MDKVKTLVGLEKEKFLPLFQEFISEYPNSTEGQRHISFYISAREEAKQNFELVKQTIGNGEDATDLILKKLLPYNDSTSNKKSGRWVHWAPVFAGDVKTKMEGIKWIKANEWPDVSGIVFNFIENAINDPGKLPDLCEDFSRHNLRGFQSGTLSPILSALKPEEFNIVNKKPITVMKWLRGKSFSRNIEDYPKINDEIKAFIKRNRDILSDPLLNEIKPEDVFDMFCHWMVAVKKYFDKTNDSKTKFWKIAPGRNAEFWNLCLQYGNMAIGWSDIGDISKASKSEFDKICDLAAQKRPDYKKAGMGQVWKFSKIKVGDKVVANRGTKEVIGIGTVTRPYYFAEEKGYSHRIDVEWEEDRGVRAINKSGWVKTLMELKREEYEEIRDIKPIVIEKLPPDEIDRDSKEDARLVFEYLFPEEEDRRLFEHLFSEAIWWANELNSDNWEVTLWANAVRLNVARAATIDYYQDLGRFTLDIQSLNSDEFSILEPYVGEGFQFTSVPGDSKSVEIPSKKMSDVLDSLKVALKSFIQNASGSSNTSGLKEYHSSGVLEYLRDYLSVELPNPSYTQGPPKPNVDSLFSPSSFELMTGLEKDPTREFYTTHQDQFKDNVEEPIKSIFSEIAPSLPEMMQDILETQKKLFSRIPKNDFGKGGAWPHYWGAFYPKGTKRIEGPQLFVWMNHSGIRFGFGLGNYSSEWAESFRKAIKLYPEVIRQTMNEAWDIEPDLGLGNLDRSPTLLSYKDLDTWLKQPQDYGFEVAVSLSKEEVLAIESGELISRIKQCFIHLFPLILACTSYDPAKTISEWLIPDVEIEPVYSIDHFIQETHFERNRIKRWERVLKRKKQIVIYGPPGTGKTFVAEKLAKLLISDKPGLKETVQFHSSYAYEDFMQGIRPQTNDGCIEYKMVPGRFLRFCSDAQSKGKAPCVLIIDEINRAKLSRVFGELMYLLEYRDQQIPLAGGGFFKVPDNVYIIGTMNTADRSIALVDHALRRRFAFIPLMPEYDVLKRFHHDNGFDPQGLIELMEKINKDIGDPNYSLGISYFMRNDLETHIQDIWEMEIEPYLEEFFYDQDGKTENYRWDKINPKIFSLEEQI